MQGYTDEVIYRPSRASLPLRRALVSNEEGMEAAEEEEDIVVDRGTVQRNDLEV